MDERAMTAGNINRKVCDLVHYTMAVLPHLEYLVSQKSLVEVFCLVIGRKVKLCVDRFLTDNIPLESSVAIPQLAIGKHQAPVCVFAAGVPGDYLLAVADSILIIS